MIESISKRVVSREVSHNIYFAHFNLNDAHHLFTPVFDPHLASDRTRRSVVYDPH